MEKIDKRIDDTERIRSQLSRDKLVEIKDIVDERMKRKSKTNIKKLFI